MSEASPKNLVDAAHLVCCSAAAAAAALLSSRCCCCVANKVCYHLLSPLPAVAVAVVGVANLARYNFLGLTFVLIHLGYFFWLVWQHFFFAAPSFALTLSRVWAEEKGSDSGCGRGGSQLLLSCVRRQRTKFVSFLLMRCAANDAASDGGAATAVLENMTKGYLSLIGFKWAGQLSNTSSPGPLTNLYCSL